MVRYDLPALVQTAGPGRCLFGTERPGSGSVADPDTGRQVDDLKAVIDSLGGLSADGRDAIYERNARAVFSRLKL